MLRVSTLWYIDGTSVLMLAEDVPRYNLYPYIRISLVLRFVAICDVFTDSPWLSLAISVWARWKIMNGWKLEKERRTTVSDKTRSGRSSTYTEVMVDRNQPIRDNQRINYGGSASEMVLSHVRTTYNLI
jgi:hypothetical protein